MTIYKYELNPGSGDIVTVEMPAGAEILTAREQHGGICVWARVNPDSPKQHRRFRVAGTGHPDVQPWLYVGTAFLMAGQLVFHVFAEPG